MYFAKQIDNSRLVKVDEPSIVETREILLGLRPRLERNYSVKISDEAISTALDGPVPARLQPAQAERGTDFKTDSASL